MQRLGGYSEPIQDSMEAEVAIASHGGYLGGDRPIGLAESEVTRLTATAPLYRLLLQLDSDDLMDAMWGDSGRLYFWIHEHALHTQRFDEAWCVLQSY